MRRATSFWTSLWFAVVVGLAMGVMPLRPAAAGVGSVTAVVIDSVPGEWAGGGLAHVFTPANSTITGSTGTWLGHNFSLFGHDDVRSFSAGVWAPTGEDFRTGTFPATRLPTETSAGLDVSTGGGCGSISGEVTILDVAVDPEGTVTSFAATFVQHCDGGPAMYGEMRFNSSVDFAAASVPTTVDVGTVLVSDQAQVSVDVASAGTVPLHLGQAVIDGPASGEWTIVTNGCSDAALPSGSACAIEVAFSPTDVGERRATLTMPDDTARGERRIDLVGIAYRLRTTVTLSTSSRTVRFGKNVGLTAHLKQFEVMPGAELTIRATPHGEVQRTIASGSVDVNGDLEATFRMRKETTFVARYTGDAAHLADASPARTVQVKPIAKGRMTKYDATSGKYRLYRFTTACPGSGRGCPTYAGTVIPAHPGKTVYGTLQLFVRGAWRTALTFRMRLDSDGKATTIFIYRDRGIIGVPTRVRFEFPGDADHLGAVSGWSYFKVTS